MTIPQNRKNDSNNSVESCEFRLCITTKYKAILAMTNKLLLSFRFPRLDYIKSRNDKQKQLYIKMRLLAMRYLDSHDFTHRI